MKRSHLHQVCQWSNVTQYYVIDSRAGEKITLCYLSTQKESCSYRYGWLETQKQSEMYHHCDSVCIEVHDPQIDERIHQKKTVHRNQSYHILAIPVVLITSVVLHWCGVLRVGSVMVVVVMINMMDIHRISWGLYPTGETLLNVAPKYKIVDLIISGETSMLMNHDLSYDSYIIYCWAFTFIIIHIIIQNS